MSAMPEETGLPFGVCDEDHPNYDVKTCPKEEFIIATILFKEMRDNQKRWITEARCQCPQISSLATKIEIWERKNCLKVCRFHVETRLIFEAENKINPPLICDVDSDVFDEGKCVDQMFRLLDEASEKAADQFEE